MSICTCTPKQKASGRYGKRCTAHTGHSAAEAKPKTDEHLASRVGEMNAKATTFMTIQFLRGKRKIKMLFSVDVLIRHTDVGRGTFQVCVNDAEVSAVVTRAESNAF